MAHNGGMVELFRSNDPVLMSFADALLADAGIPHSVADAHMSVLEGSVGVLPRRVMVADDRYQEAHQLLVDAGVEL